MITKLIAGALVAGSLALGLAIGAAGTTTAKGITVDAAPAACAQYMNQWGSMMSGQPGMMSGQTGMMSDPDEMLGWMQQHHSTVSPELSR